MRHRDTVMIDEGLRPTLRLALADKIRVMFAGPVADMVTRLRESGAAALVVSASGTDRSSLDALLAELRCRAPMLTIAIVADGTEDAATARIATRSAVTAILDPQTPEFQRSLHELIDGASREQRFARAAEAAETGLPTEVRHLIRDVVMHASQHLDVKTWVSMLPLSHKQLNERLAKHTAMSAESLILWGRLLGGIVELESTLRTVTGVALEFGYEDVSGFTALCTAKMASPPTVVARSGGSARVIAAWRAHFPGIQAEGAVTTDPS